MFEILISFYIGVYIGKVIFLIMLLVAKEISSRLEILYWILPFGGLLYIVVSFIRLGRKV